MSLGRQVGCGVKCGEKGIRLSAIGFSMDGDAEGDLGREFGLISSVGGHRW